MFKMYEPPAGAPTGVVHPDASSLGSVCTSISGSSMTTLCEPSKFDYPHIFRLHLAEFVKLAN